MENQQQFLVYSLQCLNNSFKRYCFLILVWYKQKNIHWSVENVLREHVKEKKSKLESFLPV